MLDNQCHPSTIVYVLGDYTNNYLEMSGAFTTFHMYSHIIIATCFAYWTVYISEYIFEKAFRSVMVSRVRSMS